MKRSGLWKAIIITSVTAGTLDLAAAVVSSGASLEVVCKYIASALVGRERGFATGLSSAVLGFFLHYFITFCWTTLFFLVYPKLKFMSRNIYLSGALYGVFVWTMMNMVVVPSSQIVKPPFDLTKATIGLLIIVFMVGLPIAILAQRFYSGSMFRRVTG
jgi:hypothetical protein